MKSPAGRGVPRTLCPHMHDPHRGSPTITPDGALARLLDELPDVVIVLDAVGQVVWGNCARRALLRAHPGRVRRPLGPRIRPSRRPRAGPAIARQHPDQGGRDHAGGPAAEHVGLAPDRAHRHPGGLVRSGRRALQPARSHRAPPFRGGARRDGPLPLARPQRGGHHHAGLRGRAHRLRVGRPHADTGSRPRACREPAAGRPGLRIGPAGTGGRAGLGGPWRHGGAPGGGRGEPAAPRRGRTCRSSSRS